MTITKTICLCGSKKFTDEFEAETSRLESDDVSVGLVEFDDDSDNALAREPSEEKFDNKYFREIELATEVRIINVGGFIGKSTARVIKHAQHLNKTITYLERPSRS